MGYFSKGHSQRTSVGVNKLSQGAEAENIACQYLQARGLTLIQKNYRVKCGEIDLIMTDKEYLIFVEVRYRKSNFFCDPLESVNWHKQQRIIRAANIYNCKSRLAQELPSRFDVVTLVGYLSKPEINWIPDAFWAN